MRSKLAKAVFCLLLVTAAFGGAPMCPKEIEELMSPMNMSPMNSAKVTCQIPGDQETGDDLLSKFGRFDM